MNQVSIDEVKTFWNDNPLCAANIPCELGSPEYFQYFDRMREGIEPFEFSAKLHEYSHFSQKKVLDVGCGNGYVLSQYAAVGADVTGIDITETAVDLCTKRFAYQQIYGTFLVANAEALPFADNTFDCVCSMGVLHHTPHPWRAALEIYRVMKPGGRLIVMFYHKNSLYYRWAMPIRSLVFGKSRQQLVNEFDGPQNPKGDVFTARELKRMFGLFQKIETFTDFLTPSMVLPKFGKYILTDNMLKYLAQRYGWNLYLKAWKGILPP